MVVPLADRELVLVGWRDYPDIEGCVEAVGNLDVFFGLDYAWGKAEIKSKPYLNPLLEELHNQFYGKYHVDNIMNLTIPDRKIDEDVYEFIRQQFEAGRKIGFGCLAGHGRTGWVYAKLIKEYEGCTGDEAVRRARKRFCPRCVESEEQVKDLGCEHELPSDDLRKPYYSSYSSPSVDTFNYSASDADTKPFPFYSEKDNYYKDGVKDWSWWNEPLNVPQPKVKNFQEVDEHYEEAFPTRIYCLNCQRDLLQSEADEGWCPFCKSTSLGFDFIDLNTGEVVDEGIMTEEERDKVEKIAEAYRKYLMGDKLTEAEMALLDDDFVRKAN